MSPLIQYEFSPHSHCITAIFIHITVTTDVPKFPSRCVHAYHITACSWMFQVLYGMAPVYLANDCCGLATTALCHYENMFSSTFLQERLQESSDSKFSIEVLAVSPALSCRILSQTRLTVSNVIWKHFCLLLRPGT